VGLSTCIYDLIQVAKRKDAHYYYTKGPMIRSIKRPTTFIQVGKKNYIRVSHQCHVHRICCTTTQLVDDFHLVQKQIENQNLEVLV
jgi:hypothetical protein